MNRSFDSFSDIIKWTKNIILNEKDHEKEFRFIFFPTKNKNKLNFSVGNSAFSHLHQCDLTINSMNIEDISLKNQINLT